MIDKGFIHERDDELDGAANEPEVDEDGLKVEHEDEDDIPGSDEDRVNKALSDWIKAGNPDVPIDWPEEKGDEQCGTCGGSGWVVLTGPDVVPAVCPFCNKDGRRTKEPSLNIFEQVEQAQLIKPLGKCVTLTAADGIEWKV